MDGFWADERRRASTLALGVGPKAGNRLGNSLRYPIIDFGADAIAANLRGPQRHYEATAVIKAHVKRERDYKGIDGEPNTHGLNAIF
jgi:hypothetical protein